MTTCDSCARRISGTPRKTITGRTVCAACADSLLGAAAGVVAGQDVGAATGTGGLFARLRQSARRGRS